METTAKQRLLDFMSYKGISQSKFEKMCKLSNGYLNKLRRSPSAEKLQSIISTFPELSELWLLTGEGSMLRCDGGEESAQDYNKSASDYKKPATGYNLKPVAGALERENAELKTENAELHQKVETLTAENTELGQRVATMEGVIREKDERIRDKDKTIARLFDTIGRTPLRSQLPDMA